MIRATCLRISAEYCEKKSSLDRNISSSAAVIYIELTILFFLLKAGLDLQTVCSSHVARFLSTRLQDGGTAETWKPAPVLERLAMLTGLKQLKAGQLPPLSLPTRTAREPDPNTRHARTSTDLCPDVPGGRASFDCFSAAGSFTPARWRRCSYTYQ